MVIEAVFYSKVMIDFQAAERQRLEEPASEIGLEPLCAMVCLPLCRNDYIFNVCIETHALIT